MGKKKNKHDIYDISVEEQLELMLMSVNSTGNTSSYEDECNEDFNLGDSSPMDIQNNIEQELISRLGINNNSYTNEDSASNDEIVDTGYLNENVTEEYVQYEAPTIPKGPILNTLKSKFSTERRSICIADGRQMFSVCLDNLPVFINDINNDVELINKIINIVVLNLITKFKPTAVFDKLVFEKDIASLIDNLGKDVYIFTYKEYVLLYHLDENFMDEINDAIEIAIEDGTLFGLFAGLIDISNNEFFKYNINEDNLVKFISEFDNDDYLSTIFSLENIVYAGENSDKSLSKFKTTDLLELPKLSMDSFKIINRVIDRIKEKIEDDSINEGELQEQ